MAESALPHPPAIIIGRGYTGLGALRSMVLAGVTAFIACPVDDLAARSRWYRAPPGPTPWDGKVGPGTQAVLESLQLQRAVLIPGADDAALWLADHALGPLAERFPTSASSRDTLEVFQDKAKFGQLLAQLDLPHPRTLTLLERSDVERIPFGPGDRFFLKPADSQAFSQAIGAKGVWATSPAQFLQEWQRFTALGLQVVAQEYVPGASSDHFFVDGFRDRHGRLPGLFARRRERIFPADFGNSSYCRSIPLAEVSPAIATLDRLLSETHYRGIFSAEFKRDARTGAFRLLEVNTRAWWYVEFAARCGVNVCEMAYHDALGEAVSPPARPFAIGAGCVSQIGDMKAVLTQPAARRAGLATILGQWASAHRHVFRWDDPRPGLSEFTRHLSWFFRKRWRALRRP